MIVDSCVWIDFLRNTTTTRVQQLRLAMESGARIYLTPTVLQEVLQGARSLPDFESLRERFSVLPMLEPDEPRITAEVAARLFLLCRLEGHTLKSVGDCMIAATAIEFSVPVLTSDADFGMLQSVDLRLMLIGARVH